MVGCVHIHYAEWTLVNCGTVLHNFQFDYTPSNILFIITPHNAACELLLETIIIIALNVSCNTSSTHDFLQMVFTKHIV